MPELDKLFAKKVGDKSSLSGMIHECKADKFIKAKIDEYDLTDEEIVRYYPILTAYSSDQKAKEICPGPAACSLDNPHRLSDLVMENGILTRVVGYCPCYQKIVKRRNAYLRSDFDPKLFNESAGKNSKFENGKQILNNLGLAHNGDSKRWTFISDKEHIADKYVVSYLNWCAEKDYKVAFVDYPAFVDEVKRLERYEGDHFNAQLDMMKNVDVLVINHLGSEYKTDYTRDVILMPVLRDRAIKKAETILISAHNYKDVKDLYSGSSSASRVSAKELENLLASNISKDFEVIPGVEEQF